jgi:hypothetical protein
MLRKFGTVAVLLASAIALSACVVAPGPGYAGRPRCPWVAGHYGPEGGWHPGHCA